MKTEALKRITDWLTDTSKIIFGTHLVSMLANIFTSIKINNINA